MSESNLSPRMSNETACRSGTCCALPRRWRLLVWVALLGMVLLMQWPLLKGWYYKASGSPAAQGSVAWRSGYEAALAEAGQTGKPLLLDFSASWCPPCQVMKHEVWPDAAVGSAVNASYIPVAIDVDDPANAATVRRYGIQAIPALVVTDLQGNVVRQGNFMARDELLAFLKRKH